MHHNFPSAKLFCAAPLSIIPLVEDYAGLGKPLLKPTLTRPLPTLNQVDSREHDGDVPAC